MIKEQVKRILPCSMSRADRRIEALNKKIDKQIAQISKQKAQIEALHEDIKEMNSEFKRKQYYYYCATIPEDRYPDELKNWYFKRTGRRLDLGNVKTYNEKIQWFKLYGVTPLITDLSDKIKVREFVNNRIGNKYLIPLLGTWQYPEDIDFDSLPDQFVLKANHGCGYNFIVRNKADVNRKEIIDKANSWLEEDFAFHYGFEMQYHNIQRRLLAETYLENQGGDLFDYKVWCFNGKAEYIMFLSDRGKELKMDFYDREWKRTPYVYDHPHHDCDVPRPDNLDELIEKAESLAKGFPHVRVDFYRLNSGRLYFSEMTFTSNSGVCKWDPVEADIELGAKFDIQDYRSVGKMQSS